MLQTEIHKYKKADFYVVWNIKNGITYKIKNLKTKRFRYFGQNKEKAINYLKKLDLQ